MARVFFTDHPCCARHVATEFYSQPLSQREAVAALHRLFVRWVRLTDNEGIEFWLDAGSLLGAIRDESIIPWDDDMDIGMTIPDFEKILRLKGSTEIRDGNKDWQSVYETDRDVLRISPYWRELRYEDDPCYWVDGKYVDKLTGVYIDIVVYHELSGQRMSRKYPIDECLPEYPREWILPLQWSKFEGRSVHLPHRPGRILRLEYGENYAKPDHQQVNRQWINQ